MDHQFWQNRWAAGEIGFHMGRVHHDLVRWLDRLELPQGGAVFLPLCGKAHDLVWLSDQGFQVVGVELSELAVEAFFTEHHLTPSIAQDGPFRRYRANGITLYCGDFFQLQPAHLDSIAGVFDRGSLVALPPTLRREYAAHLQRLLPESCTILTVSYDYDPAEYDGPPFAVPLPEIEELFGRTYALDMLEERDALPTHEMLAQRGLTALTEFVCLLKRR